MRLNGWQRFGVAVSICWLIGIVLLFDGPVQDRADFALHPRIAPKEYGRCYDAIPKGAKDDKEQRMRCFWIDFEMQSAAWASARNDLVLYTLASIVAGWLLVNGFIALTRWF